MLSQIKKHRRHLRSSVLFSDQDMLALPQDLLALASLMIMHRNTGQENLRHHIRANPKWRHVDPRTLVDLAEGEAAILGAGGVLAPDLAHFLARPRFVRMRQRASLPGGHTLTVV